jgi:class 3 adenylate cyclase
MSESRKLAAILAADVVGFSRMAGADEDRTLARLRTLRSDLIDPTVDVHRGRVVKRMGDGFLVEFRSVVDAVRCAVELQNSMVERNAGVPDDRRIEFRIGVHLGDVVEEADGDLMGDGVNIAARLEGIAKPGAVVLSEDAYRQVRQRFDFAISDLGETRLKNIASPVRVYSLEVGAPGEGKLAPRPHQAAAPVGPTPAKPSSRGVGWPTAAALLIGLAIVAGGALTWFGGARQAANSAHAIQVFSLPTEQDLKRIRDIAADHALILPELAFRAPSGSVDAGALRFIGAWSSEIGYNGTGSQAMLIVSTVGGDKRAEGYVLNGPSTPLSYQQHPANTFPFQGEIDGDVLNVKPEHSKVDYVAKLSMGADALTLSVIRTDGKPAVIVLKPIWRLTNGT